MFSCIFFEHLCHQNWAGSDICLGITIPNKRLWHRLEITKSHVRTFATSYDSVLQKCWSGFKELFLCYPLHTLIMMYINLLFINSISIFSMYCNVCYRFTGWRFSCGLWTRHFCIILLFCFTPKLDFVFLIKKIQNIKVDEEALDLFFNLTSASTQFINIIMSWKDGREKESESMQVLIEALITPASVVLDA